MFLITKNILLRFIHPLLRSKWMQSSPQFKKLKWELNTLNCDRIRAAENSEIELSRKVQELTGAKEKTEDKLRALEEKSAMPVGEKSLPDCPNFVNLVFTSFLLMFIY